MIEAYLIHLAILIGIYMILTVSLDLALGYTGLLNLGHVALFGIGAYTSALMTKAGVPFVIAFAFSGLFASLFGYALVFATRKLKGDYLALATMGFSFVIYSLMLNWTGLTRGPLGIPGIAKPNLFGIVIRQNWMYLIFVVVVCVAFLLFTKKMVDSPFGRLMQGTRDDETGLKVLGKNTFKIKYKVMMVAAFFAGIAGSLFAHYITYIDPSSFYLNDVILILTMVIVGGIASIKGGILATLIIMLVPEALRFLALPGSILGPVRQMIYAVILLAILLYRPKGICGRVDLA